MLEATFCKGVDYPLFCIWAWRVIAAVGIGIILLTLILPHKKDR